MSLLHCADRQLGHGDAAMRLLPEEVVAFGTVPGVTVAMAAGGYLHSACVTDGEGGLFTWGEGSAGAVVVSVSVSVCLSVCVSVCVYPCVCPGGMAVRQL